MSHVYRAEIHLLVGALTGSAPTPSPFPKGLTFDPQCPALLSAIVRRLCERGYHIKPLPHMEPLHYLAVGSLDKSSLSVWVSALASGDAASRYRIDAALGYRSPLRRAIMRLFPAKDESTNIGREFAATLDGELASIVAAAGGQMLWSQIGPQPRAKRTLSIRKY